MFVDQMASAIVNARTLTRLDHLSRAIWQGLVAQAVTDEQAQQLAELIHARRLIVRGEVKPVGIHQGGPLSSRPGGSSVPCSGRSRSPGAGT